jgi:phosphopantetheine adenylyltransferase
MAGIAPLQEIYKRKGKEFVSKLFDSYVTINEKLDASAFGVEKDPVSGNLLYYKRNTETPITKVDRTLMRYYEKPISHFEGLSEEIKSKLPPGWRFGFEYFVNEQPQFIGYDRLPKNNLVLSYVHVKNGLGETIRTVQDKQSLDDWADALGVERSPIIFQGRLNEEQRLKIMEYLDTSPDKLSSKFKTTSFVKFIISVLSPGSSKTALNEDLDKSIEGIVFRFGEPQDEGSVTLAKIIDPVFEAIAKERPKTEEDNTGDMYYIVLMDLANFIESLRMKSIPVRGKTFDDRYINFISEVFNRFIEKMGDKYEDFVIQEPAYMKKKEFELNDRFIENKRTLALVESSEAFRKIFKIALAAFRKKRKRAVGIFTKEVAEQFNGTVAKIAAYLSQGMVSEAEEMPTFGEFLSRRGGRPEDLAPEETESEVDDQDNTIANLGDVVGPSAEPAQPEKPKKDSVKKKVNIIVGRFQPFHNGHMGMVRELYEANRLPVVLVVVNTGKQTEQSPFSMSTVGAYLDNVIAENQKIMAGYVMTKRGFIDDIIAALRPKYEPVLWGVGEDRTDNYRMQLELNFRKGNPLALTDKFLIMATNRAMSGTDVRKMVEDDNFTKFKAAVPRGVQVTWPQLKLDFSQINREKPGL